MDRVSGWYKRSTQWILLVIGIAVAVGYNVNTLTIIDYLSSDSAARAALVASAEDAVRKSEAVLRAVTENTPDWLFLLDENLCVQFMNRPFGRNRPDIVLGRYFMDFVPPEYRASMEDIYRNALATGVPARLELSKPGPDGVPGNFEHRIMPVVESGMVRSLTVAVTDVTERKSAENELRTQVRILETMQEGVVLVDPTWAPNEMGSVSVRTTSICCWCARYG
jgi:PAS domain S-box-containing protein